MLSVSRSLAVLFVLSAITLACGSGGPADSKEDVAAARSRLDEQAHAAMVAELAAIADSLDPVANPWANEQRLKYFSSKPVPTDPTDRFKLQGIVANEFLNSGRSELAVQAFRQMLTTVEAYPQVAPDGYATLLRQLLGISYLRLGEQQNCLDNHSGGACILPIDSEAVHKSKEGSSGAIEVYSDILAQHPSDLKARWLLNIAHATLGQHPNGVPEQYRISTDALSGTDANFPHFRNVAPMAGLAHVSLSGGSLTEDFDGDGDLDVLVSSWGLRDSLRYFENLGDGSFADQTEAAGLMGVTGGLNMVHADYDNDGDFDVVVLRGAWLRNVGRIPNSLLRNDGAGRFTDVTVSSGIYSRKPTQAAAWADFDRDGHLDLFIGNESGLEAPNRSELFRNNGDGTFIDVAREAGVAVVGYVKGVTWIDFDNDRDPDLFVSLLGAPNILFENRDGHFTDVTTRAGVQKPYRSFPTWAWDYNNDGWEDLLVLSYEATLEDYVSFQLTGQHKADIPRLYRNRGDGSFEDVTIASNLNVPLKAMGSNFGDLDNDGWLDFYVGTGDPDLQMLIPNKMYRNTGTGFEDVTRPGGFGHLQKGHAVSFADIDNDGDQDVHAVMGGALSGDRFQNVLFQNPGNENHWLSLRFRGHRSNRAGVGARIAVTVLDSTNNSWTIHRTVSSGGSFGGSSFRQSIGLGADVVDVAVEIRWPSGTVQLFDGVALDSFYLVDEVEGLVQSR